MVFIQNLVLYYVNLLFRGTHWTSLIPVAIRIERNADQLYTE